jgi:iron-sulfur cluster assembly protein
LALDEPKENDDTYNVEGLKFVVDKGLIANCREIKIDFIDAGARSGFSISSPVPLSGTGSCASSCGSGGSCGC